MKTTVTGDWDDNDDEDDDRNDHNCEGNKDMHEMTTKARMTTTTMKMMQIV
jgi:hypothetical protein